MSSLPVVYDPSAASAARSAAGATTLPAAAIAAARAAANDETAAVNVNTVANPLWIMPIGMAVFFAAAAAVIALG